MKRFSDFPNSSVCFLMKQTCYKLSLQNKASWQPIFSPTPWHTEMDTVKKTGFLFPVTHSVSSRKATKPCPTSSLHSLSSGLQQLKPGECSQEVKRLPSFLHPSPANSGSSVHQPLGPEPQGLDCFFPCLFLGHRFQAREESQESW